MIKVCKFGGTSMADGMTIRRVREIIKSDPARRFLVVSAPGKRYSGEPKVTDLLLKAHAAALASGECGAAFERVKRRFRGIVGELGLDIDFEEILQETEEEILRERSEAFTASRGEYLAGRLCAAFFDLPFLDAKELIFFRPDGKLDGEKTYRLTAEALAGKDGAVIPGFYGSDPAGRIAVFSRGGSDISGAVVSRAVNADLYENWTDVSGFLASDPRVVENPARIKVLTFWELRALAHMGAEVLHAESIFPVEEAQIPICVKNTFRPDCPGTLILPKREGSGAPITGIAAKKPYTAIRISGGQESLRTALGLLKTPIELMQCNSEAVLLVVGGGLSAMEVLALADREKPARVKVFENLALVRVVGDMKSVGVAARVFKAVAQTGVNVRTIEQGASGLELTVGVDGEDSERTVRAIYDEFFRRE